LQFHLEEANIPSDELMHKLFAAMLKFISWIIS